ncbi:MAG: hypothetical protein WBV94_09010 [Blastocatellia bacterium]
MARKKVPQDKKEEVKVPANTDYDAEALPSHYSKETIEEKQANAALVGEIVDEWYGQISSGDPFYEAAKPYIDKYPDKYFRWLSDPHCQRRTDRGYQRVYDAKGRLVQCARLWLGWIPRWEYERREKERADRATSALAVSKDTYKEAQRRAAKDSDGGIEILPDEDERIVGNRRVAA